MGGFLILLSMAAFVVVAISFFRPFPRLGLTTKARSAVAVVGSFLLFAIGGSLLPPVPENVAAVSPAAAVASSAPAVVPKPVSVRAADPAIRGVADSPEYFVIDLKPNSWRDGDRIFSAGSAIQSVGGAMQQGAADRGKAPTIALTVTADMVDRLGVESEQIILTLFFDRADLQAARFDNLSVGRTLNLATDMRFNPHGAQELLAYCTSDRGREQSVPFCALAELKAPG